MKLTALAVVILVLVALMAACGGDGQDSGPTEQIQEPTTRAEEPTTAPAPAEDLQDARVALTATAEAEHMVRVGGAAGVGETQEIRFYPDEAVTFELDETKALRVTVTRFEIGSPLVAPTTFSLVCMTGLCFQSTLRCRWRILTMC